MNEYEKRFAGVNPNSGFGGGGGGTPYGGLGNITNYAQGVKRNVMDKVDAMSDDIPPSVKNRKPTQIGSTKSQEHSYVDYTPPAASAAEIEAANMQRWKAMYPKGINDDNYAMIKDGGMIPQDRLDQLYMQQEGRGWMPEGGYPGQQAVPVRLGAPNVVITE